MRLLAAVVVGLCFCLCTFASLAEGRKKADKERGEEGSLDEEISTLEDADYPDLVAVDEEGGIMDEFALLEESAVVESAARHRQEIGMSPSAVTVITRKDIEASGATTIPDLLRLVPGMDVIVATPAFSAINTRLAWSHKNNVFLVLIDGRDTTVEFMGMPFLEMMPISLDDIERVEVIRGPGSALYGANAFAGVVSITTRSIPEKASGWARLAGGEAGRLGAGARASTRLGDFGFSLSGEADLRQDFMDRRAEVMQMLKLRAVVEYRRSANERLLLDAAVSQGGGPIPTNIGTFQGELRLTTIKLDYDAADLKSHLYWTWVNADAPFNAPLEYNRVLLARLVPTWADGNVLDGEVQWTLPELWNPLMVIVGGGGRLGMVTSDELLDAQSYSNPGSSRYHQTGIDYLEVRASSFLHAELSPADWVTVTGGIRLDYNTETGFFASPRLAAVFRPAEKQFVRLGVARAFRKPSFMETDLHAAVSFPEESPITGADQYRFQEFMTRVVGADGLENEELVSIEGGYLGHFLDGRLRVAVDLYYNLHLNWVAMFPNIITDAEGLPDLGTSSFQFANSGDSMSIVGSELAVHVELTRSLSLVASWTHREFLVGDDFEGGRVQDQSPKNLMTLGLRRWSPQGLVGSLYAFSRSEFVDVAVENPDGILEPLIEQHLDSVFLLMGRAGWRWRLGEGVGLEAGLKLFLPVSPFSPQHFCYREKGGMLSSTGKSHSGEELCRMVTGYLQGSF